MGKIGQLHPSNSLFLRIHTGKAKDEETGIHYEMSTNGSSCSPIICSSKTGRYFTLSWQEIIDLAIAAGIDEPTEDIIQTPA